MGSRRSSQETSVLAEALPCILDRRRPIPQAWICPERLDYRTATTKIKPTLARERVDYRVELDVYNGPMDLLLYLIKRDELDIYDIPIARITNTYMTYMQMLKDLRSEDGLDINVAGEFLVMAATLMEI